MGNVHVGVHAAREPSQLIRADASEMRWEVEVSVVQTSGSLDFRGPSVHGKRGDRFLYLSWGTVDDADHFEMFRRAKLMFDAVPGALLRSAQVPGHRLVGTVNMTHGDGMPRCAAVRPPVVEWTVEEAHESLSS